MRENVLIEEPNAQSRASLVLLQRAYIKQVVYHGYQGWLRFRIETLERWQTERATLTCHYCGLGPLLINEDNKHPFCATLDHVIPRSRGGANFDLANLVVACSPCNGKKADKLLLK